MSFKSIALVGDLWGLGLLLKYIPRSLISCLVCSSVRPQYVSDIQVLAARHSLPLLIQPKRTDPSYSDFYAEFLSYRADSLICNSYSLLIQPDILDSIQGNAFNVHPSYLPFNRGPHPVQWSLIKGDSFTGVTLHKMNNQFDCGDIIFRCRIDIPLLSTWVDLESLVNEQTDRCLSLWIPSLLNGDYQLMPQPPTFEPPNHKLNKDYPRIDFASMSNLQIYNLIRGQVRPLSGAFVELNDGSRRHFNEFVPLESIQDIRDMYSEL